MRPIGAEMYNRFYHLKENPFSETADIRYFFAAKSHTHTLNTIFPALQSGKGFFLVNGEVGSGKTLLAKLTEYLLRASGVKTALILQPLLEGEDLLAQIGDEFGAPQAQTKGIKAQLDRVNGFLMASAEQGISTCLIVDEAHKLSFDALETIRMLSNLEAGGTKLMQVALFAQEELEIKMRSHSLRQMEQRLTSRAYLKPLTLEETRAYLNHRLHFAGGQGFVRFEDSAIRAIHKKSNGLPRLVNFYAESALRAGEASAVRVIGSRQVRAGGDSERTWLFNLW